MSIEIKISKKPVEYTKAVKFMEERLENIKENKASELIWILEHKEIYTAGSSFKNNEILDKSIKIKKTNRGGKITWHGPGQIVCYFVLDLNKRNRDIRKFLTIIENAIIETLNEYKIKSFSDKENIGIWIRKRDKIYKVASIGIRVKKWIAYHGFALNLNNNIKVFSKIIPCGIRNKKVINLKMIKNISYKGIEKKLIKNFIKNL